MAASCRPVPAVARGRQRAAGRPTRRATAATSRIESHGRQMRWGVNSRPVDNSATRHLAKAATSSDPASDSQKDNTKAAVEGRGYDWLAHWYPVMWEQDLEQGKPTKVTLFDVDYCVVRHTSELGGGVMCLQDVCPHRMAALSEGRMTETGLLQCAYHGWSFDKSGECVDIPSSPKAQLGSRTCASALPCQLLGRLVWVFPGALHGREPEKPPNVPPEMLEGSGWSVTSFVRDFPIDYSMLVENITDPDHGLFAHQSTPFDFYTGSSKYPQRIQVEEGDSLKIIATVQSANKLTWESGTAKEEAPKACKDPDGNLLTATTTFSPPLLITMGRRDKEGKCKFIPVFFVVPVGLGRSRLLLCSAANGLPAPPRWLISISTNNFLDQDSQLVATCQAHYLPWEVETVQSGEALNRRAYFNYQSPSENLLIVIGKFMDNALPSMPNRYSPRAVSSMLSTVTSPSRATVLDRWAQHTAICPTSMGLVRKAKAAASAALAIAAATITAIVFTSATVLCGVQPGTSAAQVGLACLKACKAYAAVTAVSLLLAVACSKLLAEFRFKYEGQLRDSDLTKIPSVYPDAKGASS